MEALIRVLVGLGGLAGSATERRVAPTNRSISMHRSTGPTRFVQARCIAQDSVVATVVVLLVSLLGRGHRVFYPCFVLLNMTLAP